MYQKYKLESLFKSNYDALCMYSMHYVNDIETAEDIVMDCFLKFYEKRDSGQEILSPKQYLYRMTKNASIDFVRESSVEIDIDNVAETLENIDGTIDRSEREARLWNAIDQLPPVRKKVLLMSKRDGMKHEEIAKALGISVKTVESHIYKAYKTLRGKAKDIYVMLFL